MTTETAFRKRKVNYLDLYFFLRKIRTKTCAWPLDKFSQCIKSYKCKKLDLPPGWLKKYIFAIQYANNIQFISDLNQQWVYSISIEHIVDLVTLLLGT